MIYVSEKQVKNKSRNWQVIPTIGLSSAEFWNSTITCCDGQALLEQTQMEIQKFLNQVSITASESQVKVGYEELRAPLEAIYSEYNFFYYNTE